MQQEILFANLVFVLIDQNREVSRLAKFLGIPLPVAKLERLANFVSFEGMAARGAMTTRKGITRDFESHLDPARWAQVDRMFGKHLGNLAIFAPLLPYCKSAETPQQ